MATLTVALALLALPAWAAGKGQRKRVKPVAQAIEPRRSVVVMRTGEGRPTAASRLAVASDWTVRGHTIGHGFGGAATLGVRCDLCVSSAANAEPGVPSIAALDLRALTNRLTTLQIRDTTVKLTSLQPLGLVVRKPF